MSSQYGEFRPPKTVVTCAIIACNFAAILAGVAKIIAQLF